MAGNIEDFWQPSFETLYDACFYEFASELIITRWNRLHIVTAFMAAATAVGSTISGWALWSDPKGKIIWAGIAGLATVLSILHGVLAVPTKIKEEEKRRQVFSALRVDLETFRHDLTLRYEAKDAGKDFEKLRGRLSDGISATPPDLVFTKSARKKVQEQVNIKLRKYIEH